MTIREATAVNVLLDLILDPKVDAQRVMDAGEILANKAHAALSAGIDGREWRRRWEAKVRRTVKLQGRILKDSYRAGAK